MKKYPLALIVLAALLVAGRMYLPVWVTNYVDRALDTSGYHGSVKDVDLNLYRGAYQIHGLKMTKGGGIIPVPFLDIDSIDLSIHWSALFHGKLVGEVHLLRPTVNFVVAVSKPDAAEQLGTEVDWVAALESLMPFRINRFTIADGVLVYRDFNSEPQVNVALQDLHLTAENLSNVETEGVDLPSTIEAAAIAQEGGTFQLSARVNLLKPVPDFDLNARAEDVPLPALNEFANAYAQMDFEKGTLNLYGEMAVADGILEGYVKPLLLDVEVVDLPEDSSNPLELVWEAIAGFFAELMENQPREQVATRVPLEGNLNNVEGEMWPAIGGILKNAFIEAVSKGTDGSISFEDAEQQKDTAKSK